MMEGPDTLSKSFGLSIAFLIPGAVGLYAASFFAPIIRDWFAVSPDGPAVGGFLFVILGSIGMGVFISGLRWFVLDWLLGEQMGLTWFPQYPAGLDLTRRKDEQAEAAYQDLIFRHYQFYQFYVNLPFALALAYAAWFVTGEGAGARAAWMLVVMIAADVVLFASGRHALSRYRDKLVELLGREDSPAVTSTGGLAIGRDDNVPPTRVLELGEF